jgi:predicted transcriptional regulator
LNPELWTLYLNVQEWNLNHNGFKEIYPLTPKGKELLEKMRKIIRELYLEVVEI